MIQEQLNTAIVSNSIVAPSKTATIGARNVSLLTFFHAAVEENIVNCFKCLDNFGIEDLTLKLELRLILLSGDFKEIQKLAVSKLEPAYKEENGSISYTVLVALFFDVLKNKESINQIIEAIPEIIIDGNQIPVHIRKVILFENLKRVFIMNKPLLLECMLDYLTLSVDEIYSILQIFIQICRQNKNPIQVQHCAVKEDANKTPKLEVSLENVNLTISEWAFDLVIQKYKFVDEDKREKTLGLLLNSDEEILENYAIAKLKDLGYKPTAVGTNLNNAVPGVMTQFSAEFLARQQNICQAMMYLASLKKKVVDAEKRVTSELPRSEKLIFSKDGVNLKAPNAKNGRGSANVEVDVRHRSPPKS